MIDPAIPTNANALLREQGIRPRKRWGQNFLCDRNVLDRIAEAAGLAPDEKTLEIGAGLGSLTRSLADLSKFVTTVEIDPLLLPILHKTLTDKPNVRLIHNDILKMDMSALMDEAFGSTPGVVVANIPYYITTPILDRLLEHKSRIRKIVLLVQEEFARRMVAKEDTEDFGAMTLYVQYHTRVQIVMKVSKHVFLPSPEVGSAVIMMEPVVPGTVDVGDEAMFFKLTRAAFCKRRKTILNALSSGNIGIDKRQTEELLNGCGFDPGRRGETFSLEEFATISRKMFLSLQIK